MNNTLRMPAKLASMESFRSFVFRQIEGAPRLEALSANLDLVMEELLTNIMFYAYPEKEGEIEVQCDRIDEGGLRIMIRDWGTPFNPLEKAPPNLELDIDERQIGGLGIYLVRELAREVLYRYENGANVLTVHFSAGEG